MANTVDIVREIVENIVFEKKIGNPKIDIKPLSTEGANYTSVLYRITVKYNDEDQLHLFSKVASISETIRHDLGSCEMLYENEKVFYTDIVPIFEKLQNKYEIPLDERFKTPKYYGSSTKYMEETLVLEDLTADGYILHDRLLSLSSDYIFKAAKELAKFHVLSIALKNHHREKYYTFVNRFGTTMLDLFRKMKETFVETTGRVHAIIPDHMKARFKKYVDKQLEEESFRKYYGPGKWKILVHGDYRASNIMHKSENGKVSSLVPVDYQTLHLGSPSTDLLILIYLGTDEYFRRAHLTQLLDLYYDTLSSWLRRMELDPDRLFSRRDFDEDYQDMLPYGLNMAIFFLPLVLVDPKQAPTLSSEDSCISDFVADVCDSFKQRFLPILKEFVDMGII